jgi:predicted metal-dependent phosphoesterase TrpH
MVTAGRIAWLLFGGGLILGSLSDTDPRSARMAHGGEHVLAVDFHVHGFVGDGALAPWALRREAARRGLDVIAITNHNQTVAARVGSWLAARSPAEGPIVLIGQEVTTPQAHVIAVGIHQVMDWRLPLPELIEAIHAQGGVAIAAHPSRPSWRGFEASAVTRLDGAEVASSSRSQRRPGRDELGAFYRYAKALNPHLAPIGSSDFHSTAPVGECRTYVFVREVSERGIIDAVRNGRTVAYNDVGPVYGDPDRIAIVEQLRRDTDSSREGSDVGRHVSVALTWLGAVLLACGVTWR